MKKELMDFEVEEVVGGTICLAASIGIVGFSQLGETYNMTGDPTEMRNLLFALEDANQHMNALEFDTLVRNEFMARGWLG